MNLKQLNEKQLKKLINSEKVFIKQKLLVKVIPPKQFLINSIERLHNTKKAIWSLPYFMEKKKQIVGCCGFKSTPSIKTVEIGYNVTPEVRRKGVATSAVAQLCKIAFDSGSVETVEALISSDNKASLKVIQKNNFKFKNMVKVEKNVLLECWQKNK